MTIMPPSVAVDAQPRRPAFQRAPSTANGADKPSKSVQIADSETFQFAEAEVWPKEESNPKKQFRASLGDRRLSGRMPSIASLPLISPGLGTANMDSPLSPHVLEHSYAPSYDDATSSALVAAASNIVNGSAPSSHHGTKTPQSGAHTHRHRVPKSAERLLAQVAEWLEHERNKAERRKLAPKVPRHRSLRSGTPDLNDASQADSTHPLLDSVKNDHTSPRTRTRSDSIDSQASDDVSLDRLQRIIEDSVSALGLSSVPSFTPRLGRRPSRKWTINRTNSSDTEYVEGDVVVPSCDGVLDVSKTLTYSGGQASSTLTVDLTSKKHKEKERQAWTSFKNEIIRLTHTLKLKGWRRIPLDSGDSISVERISGALTNAVYMVSPPTELPADGSASPTIAPFRKAPPKLLLRVYGPQVEALIDRETELAVLKRLARKKIGPRLLGTFENGRFEEFFNAITLQPQNMREPETSRQIAKRMRELHLGIDLLPSERLGGPAVFKNWDKWVNTVEKLITTLDARYEAVKNRGELSKLGPLDGWMKNGYICGVEWPKFCEIVWKHREFVISAYGSKEVLQESLVFCHNDTQYGNILRVKPDNQKSPFLRPANKHKQLVVIDFEYAAANVAGLDIANHFTEWTYNYHDPTASHKCSTSGFPSREEQLRFIRAYVEHRPEFPHSGTTSRMTPLNSLTNTPHMGPISSSASIVDFMLDARSSAANGNSTNSLGMNNALASISKDDLSLGPSMSGPGLVRDVETERRVQELIDEAILWRAANSAQWVAWGIVQAKMPEEEGKDGEKIVEGGEDKTSDNGEDEDEQFDYLGYAQDRAMFFWGDMVVLGLVKKEDLPEKLQQRIKIVRK